MIKLPVPASSATNSVAIPECQKVSKVILDVKSRVDYYEYLYKYGLDKPLELKYFSSNRCDMTQLISSLSEEQWSQYNRDGFLVFNAATEEEVSTLNERIDEIMLGKLQYGDSLLMQIDPNSSHEHNAAAEGSSNSDGEYELYNRLQMEIAGQSPGFKGPSLAYRKIGEAQCGLEVDPLFRSFMQKPLFRHICDRVYGAHAGIGIYRAMVMSKPPGRLGGGAPLPWHQDGGEWWALDRDPLCFVWLALTDATLENGAVQAIRGSHHRGLMSRRGHTLSSEHIGELVGNGENVTNLVLKAGQAFLCHNWVAHRSGVNVTDAPRRGFSCNYIDIRTQVLDPKPELAGPLGGMPGDRFYEIFPSPLK